MLLHISEERRVVHAGHVAEWCPACDGPAPFKMERAETRTRLMLIPVSGWKKRAEHAVCARCRLKLYLDAASYPQLSGVTTEISELIRQTNPPLADATRTRDDRVQRARAGRLLGPEREEAVAESLRRAGKAIKPRTRSTAIGEAIGIVFVSLVFSMFLTLALMAAFEHSRWLRGPQGDTIAWSMYAASNILIIAAFLVPARFIRPLLRSRLYSSVGKAVAPLSPTHEEIASAVLAERARKNPLCRRVAARAVIGRIANAAIADPFAALHVAHAA